MPDGVAGHTGSAWAGFTSHPLRVFGYHLLAIGAAGVTAGLEVLDAVLPLVEEVGVVSVA